MFPRMRGLGNMRGVVIVKRGGVHFNINFQKLNLSRRGWLFFEWDKFLILFPITIIIKILIMINKNQNSKVFCIVNIPK